MKQFRYVDQLSHEDRLARLLWGIVYWLAFRPTPRWTLHAWRRSVLRLFGAQIGAGCRIDPRVRIWAPWKIVFGDYVAIAEGVDIYSVDRIEIGSKVTISQRTFLCTASHDITDLRRPLIHAPIAISNHCWIAAEVMVHPGTTIEEGAVVAARAVLRHNASAWTIWAGNPARQVGHRKLTPEARAMLTEQNS